MSAPHQTTSSEFIEEAIFDIVKDVFGDIPLMRADTPLLALGFQPSHAVLLAHLSKVAGLNVPTDHDFTSMNTIGDFAGVCHSGVLVIEPNLSQRSTPDHQSPEGDPEALAVLLRVECDMELLDLALVHRSFAYENGGLPTNERLEFLGDSVLGLVVTDTLYRDFPDLPEGQLARMRASVVNAQALADVARSLGLGSYIRLGKGEISSGGRDKTSILADCMEAVIGAIYLSSGMVGADPFISDIFGPLIKEASQMGAGLDWKTSLQELTGQHSLKLPEYRISDSGPDHAKSFMAEVIVGSEILGIGHGSSKKVAEQISAQQAYLAISDRFAH